ncbi:MAG TPA: flagellar basal body P-ring protein FlgI [Polyangiales bacterium]|nr:flagellar basal body P-ring protein FlgI [Polyangiales bacterium]
MFMTQYITQLRVLALTLGMCLAASPVQASRIAELCDVHGVRPNQLIGYGLVVGLGGTGDTGQARFTVQSTAAMLRRLGATIDPKSIQTKNAAAVMVTATLPAYGNPGTRIDVLVSSIGNAKSIEGGTLLQTPLFGADRVVYAVGQGALLVGGFQAEGAGSSVKQNTTTVGRVPMGAIVERRAPTPAVSNEAIILQLRNPSFVTATRIAQTINQQVGPGAAQAIDSGTVKLIVGDGDKSDPVALLARVQLLDVEADAPVRIVIDERTGTVVLGSGVRISEVAIAQGGLTIAIAKTPIVSQPSPFARRGETKVVEQGQVTATVEGGAIHHMPASASLSEVVAALNLLGAKPRNLIAIFEALRSSGALTAEIEVQ